MRLQFETTTNDCGKILHIVDLYSHVIPTKQAPTWDFLRIIFQGNLK